ncbi:MAG: uroporphyrinogen-III synthase [Pseudomonadota bacterium]
MGFELPGVLFTRSSEENTAAISRVEKLNFNAYSAPMLYYKDVDPYPISHKNHIIITSKYAAKIIAVKHSSHAECWVVGKESAKILERNPYLKITGISKNLKELLSVIKFIPEEEMGEFFENSLYLSGNIITEELPKFIERHVIYETCYTKELPQNVIETIQNYQIQYIMVYSKNCAVNLISLLTSYNLLPYIRASVVMALSQKIASIFDGLVVDTIYSHSANFEDTLKLLVQYEKARAEKN